MRLSNNLMLFAILIIIVINIFNIYVYYTIGLPKISGRVTSGLVHLCIGKPSIINFIYPNEWDVLNGVINVSVIATNPDGPHYVQWVLFSYGISAVNDFCQDNYDGDSFYSCILNTSLLPEGNCNYFFMARCQGPCSQSGTTHYYISINNIDEPPVWDNFKNNITTNFSKFSSWGNISNAVIGIPGKVVVNFSGQTINFDSANLDSYLLIGQNYLNINIDALKCLRKPATVTFYNLSFDVPKILRNNQVCVSPLCSLVSYDSNSVTFSAIYLNGIYNVTEGATLNLKLLDTSDFRKVYVKEEMSFYANLTNSVGRVINFSDVYCDIMINETNHSYAERMSFNQELQLYEFKKTFYRAGNFKYAVVCNATTHYYNIIENSSTFTITNRPPILVNLIPNQTWLENTMVSGIDLDDYFVDPDGDVLNYTHSPVQNIQINISPSNVVTFIPQNWWYGNRTVIFYAYDPYRASNESNVVYLTVIHVPRPELEQSQVGGGGGTGSSEQSMLCTPKWECTEFGLCLATGIRVRKCIDANNCQNENLGKPKEFEYCNYTPTCFDLLKNGNEEWVDCGGPCKPCPSCYNLIQDQGETGVDCGGPCKPCPSCSNGIQDFGEEGIDCGVVCNKSCSRLEIPGRIKKRISNAVFLLALSMIAVVSSGYLVLKKLRKQKEALIPEKVLLKSELNLRSNDLILDFIRGIFNCSEIQSIFRKLISESLEINYEFTTQELEKEMAASELKQDLKQRILNFSSLVESKIFSNEKMGIKEYEASVNELRGLVEDILTPIIAEEIKFLEEEMKRRKFVSEIKKLIRDIQSDFKENKTESAEAKYSKLKRLYSKLPLNLKKKYYSIIIKLYEQLNRNKES
ncbi:MAG: hypothetical protein ACP5OZ_01070 [Candidatus Woesearchaeota archaeon]